MIATFTISTNFLQKLGADQFAGLAWGFTREMCVVFFSNILAVSTEGGSSTHCLFVSLVIRLFVYNINMFWIFYASVKIQKKDFNFLDTLWVSKNTLPPKYKYFVVQQFFNPNPWFGVETHLTIKTY
jgi:hypothetical protein